MQNIALPDATLAPMCLEAKAQLGTLHTAGVPDVGVGELMQPKLQPNRMLSAPLPRLSRMICSAPAWEKHWQQGQNEYCTTSTGLGRVNISSCSGQSGMDHAMLDVFMTSAAGVTVAWPAGKNGRQGLPQARHKNLQLLAALLLAPAGTRASR